MSTNTVATGSEKQTLSGVTITVVLICWFMTIFEGYDIVVYGTVVPSLLHYKPWGLNPGQAGVIGSLIVFGMFFGALFVGPLADLFGRRTTMIVDLLIFSISMFLCGLSPTPLVFSIFRFIGGVGLGGIIPTTATITVEYAPLRWRSLVYTIMFTGYSVGGILAAGLAIPLLPAFGWQVMFYINAVACLVAVPLAYWFLPESIGFLLSKNRRAEAERVAQRFRVNMNSEEVRLAQREIEGAHAARGWRAPLLLFSRGYLLATVLFALVSFCALYTIYGVNTWLPQLMTLSGYSLTSALLFLLVLNVGNIIGNVIAGAAADRFGSKIVCMTVFALAAISFFLLSFKVPLLIGYILVILVGNGTYGAQNLLNAYVVKSYPVSSRGTAIGWALGIGRTGGFVAPNLIGLFLFWHVPLQWSFYVLAIPGVLAVIALLFITKTPAFYEHVQVP
ncbi:MAG: aromatic acid/H+ symport family MFS transporter, partial [Chloroflexi bacterium]|nr:aromatic acid/H+ symport family MFS transporter [Chloroflexota bacterium]